MKKKILLPIIVAAIIISALLVTSCIKQKCTDTLVKYKYTAQYQPMSALRNIQVQAPKAINKAGKIFVKDNYLFIAEIYEGFHVINNTNPANPIKIAFVKVPGIIDIVGNGNFIFVDNYLDLLTFNISNPSAIVLASRTTNALPKRMFNYGLADMDSNNVITGFVKTIETTEQNCNIINTNPRGGWGWAVIDAGASFSNTPRNNNSSNNTGKTGSLSRFTVNNNYLYCLAQSNITPINITNPLLPTVMPKVLVTNGETLLAYNNALFMGSPNGMFVYTLTNPNIPTYVSAITHFRGCDPVAIEGNKAYVTIRGGGACGSANNQLDIVDITTITAMRLLKTYQLTNPYGVGVANNIVAVCDGTAGLKILNVADVNNIELKANLTNEKAFDVIMDNNLAILIGADGLYQYNIANPANPTLVSKINITN